MVHKEYFSWRRQTSPVRVGQYHQFPNILLPFDTVWQMDLGGGTQGRRIFSEGYGDKARLLEHERGEGGLWKGGNAVWFPVPQIGASLC